MALKTIRKYLGAMYIIEGYPPPLHGVAAMSHYICCIPGTLWPG
tara:strand:- start:229 stop:360 length:132 start_codon:yes stop_codon:yes gene_type:complete